MTNPDKNGNIRVLVVESDRQLARLVENSLAGFARRVSIAGNANAAFQQLMEDDFDVCVIDLDMTNIDGIAFLQESLKVWPWLGVVALSSDKDNRRLLQDLGDFPLVEKPFTFNTLLEQVRQSCQDKQQREDGEQSQENIQLENIQFKLRGLRKLMEGALQANTLVESLRFLCMGIGQILPFAVVGVMGSEEEYIIILNVQKKVSDQFTDHLTTIIHNRYEALTGRTVPVENIRIEKAGIPTEQAGASEIGTTFSVPIIAAGELRGIITIGTLPGINYSSSDVTFMYYAANQLSTVFTAMTQIRNLAIRDPMTGLFNRLQLDREMDRHWRRQVDAGQPLGVVIMDVDHFKAVNDTYGHVTGDNVLRELAKMLQESCHESYVIGRYGGEEFVIIMPDADQETAIGCAASFIEKVRSHVFCADKNPLRITVSLGLSFFDPATNPEKREKHPEQMLTEADQAMYMAKRSGRDCLRVWSDQSQEVSDSSVSSLQDITMKSIYKMQRREPGILIIEDDYSLQKLLEKIIAKEGYRVSVWDNPVAALEYLKKKPAEYDLVMVDLSMPEMKGIEVVREILAVDETLIVVTVAGHAMIGSAVECLRVGAYDVVQKPFQFEQIKASLRRSLGYRRTLLENRQYEQHLLEMVRQNSAKVIESMEEIKTSYNFTLEALVGLLDARERGTGNHSKRVRDLTLLLARRMGFVGTELEDISRGALLHDIGKIGVPDAILLKQNKLTDQEWQIMRLHPTVGYRILQYSSYLQKAAEIVYAHQEKWDGSGYPRGLAGKDICQGARIFSVIDAYDAMRTNRHYRDAMSVEQAQTEIANESGRQFDPEVVAAFLEHLEEIEKLLQLLFRQTDDLSLELNQLQQNTNQKKQPKKRR